MLVVAVWAGTTYEGETLKEQIARGTLALDDAVDIDPVSSRNRPPIQCVGNYVGNVMTELGMAEPGTYGRTNAAGGAISLKTGAVLWVGGMFGVVCVLPYVVRLQRATLQVAIEQTGLPLPMLLALSVAQAAVVLAIAVATGAWASRRIGLGAPLLESFAQGGTLPRGTTRILQAKAG